MSTAIISDQKEAGTIGLPTAISHGPGEVQTVLTYETVPVRVLSSALRPVEIEPPGCEERMKDSM